MTPLDHLEALARAGWYLSIFHIDDNSQGAPTPTRKVFDITAARNEDDATHYRRGRAETLTEAIEQAAQGDPR